MKLKILALATFLSLGIMDSAQAGNRIILRVSEGNHQIRTHSSRHHSRPHYPDFQGHRTRNSHFRHSRNSYPRHSRRNRSRCRNSHGGYSYPIYNNSVYPQQQLHFPQTHRRRVQHSPNFTLQRVFYNHPR